MAFDSRSGVNFVAIDVPVLARKKYDAESIYDTSAIKSYFANIGVGKTIEAKPCFTATPVNYGEDDVDTGIHYLFTHILGKVVLRECVILPVRLERFFGNRWQL